MTDASKRIYWIPLVLLVMMLLDGVGANIFSPWLIDSGNIIVPRLVVITLVMFALLIESPHIWWISAIIGLVYDSYFSGILGIYTAIFPIIVYFISIFKQNILTNAFTIALMVIVFITFMEFAVFFFYSFLGHANMENQLFIIKRLMPTLVLNTVLYYLLYLPLRNLSYWISGNVKTYRSQL